MTVECNACQKQHTIGCDELEWSIVDSDERQMGAESHHQAEYEFSCDCGKSLEITFNCWEYPQGTISYSDTEVRNCDVINSENCCPNVTWEDEE